MISYRIGTVIKCPKIYGLGEWVNDDSSPSWRINMEGDGGNRRSQEK